MRLLAGQIVVVDCRDALPKEPSKVRPCVIVEDADIFDPAYPNVIIVPLTQDMSFAIPELVVKIAPTPENGCTKASYAISHCVTTASKQRIRQVTPSHISGDQLSLIRRQIAESIGLA